MSRRTILNLSPAYFAGAYDYFTFEKIRLHDRERYRFVLVYLRRESDEPNRMEDDGFPCRYLFESGRPIRLFPAALRLAHIVREEKVDVIHAHNRVAIVTATWAKILSGNRVRVVGHVHSLNLVRKLKRRLFYRLFGRRIDAMIGCSEATSRFIREKVRGVPPGRVVTIDNSIAIERYAVPALSREGVRRELGFAPDDFVFVALGRLAKEKWFEGLLRAFAGLAKDRRNLRLAIVGEGGEREKLERLRRELELTETTVLPGFRKDVCSLLHAADAFVLSSWQENLPLAILEAVACRLPVVATDCGGVREVVESLGAGFVVPVRDENALAGAMGRSVDMDADRRAAMISAAADRLAERFSHEAAVARTEALYEHLME